METKAERVRVRVLVAQDLDDEPLAPDAAPAPFLSRATARAFLSPTRSRLLERALEWFFVR